VIAGSDTDGPARHAQVPQGTSTDALGTLMIDSLVRSMADRAQMEVVRPHDEGGPDSPGTDASAPWHETDDARVLELLLALVSEGPPSDELPARALDRVVELLGLSGATLSLVFESDGTLQLEPVASVGAHAAFARDMSARPLETLADVATAVAEGTPVFVVDSHGPATTPASKTGVGRWRSTISAHATGVLPVRVWGRTLGVLTVEWPGSRPLEERERKLLESVAGVLGVMLDRMERTASAAAEDEVDAVESASDTEFVYGVTAEGVVIPLSGDAAEESGNGADGVCRCENGAVRGGPYLGRCVARPALAGVCGRSGGVSRGPSGNNCRKRRRDTA
jgi:hypothetical protein